MHRFPIALLLLFIPAAVCCADGPKDNHPENVRRVPKLGIQVPDADHEKLTAGLKQLGDSLATLNERAKSDSVVAALTADISIYHRAVSTALQHQEFFAKGDIAAAHELLAEAQARVGQLKMGAPQWPEATGLVVRGYVSKLDKTVQPYGLVIPANYDGSSRVRLDVWFHGRGETLSEVKFLQQRRKSKGVFAPKNTIVLHPYGRYSNANKFAGEVDVLEAIADVQRRYNIDPNRIAVRGFSMGGASTWQLAVHYPTRWVAANPGAGFSETPEFLKSFQAETLNPTWWEEKLWNWYDCNKWAVNLSHCPTVAYSGEMDRQKQAADVMAKALSEQGMELVHEIGPKTGHKYHPATREIVDRKIGQIAAIGRQRLPRNVHFVTYTLRYNRCAWVTVEGLEEHWEQARVDAKLMGGGLRVTTKNVSAIRFELPPGASPFDATQPVQVTIDGQQPDTKSNPVRSDRSWELSLVKEQGKWTVGEPTGLRKRSLLQGPIDDAFMDAFLFVTPTRSSEAKLVDQWSRSELERGVVHWRRHFRGDAQQVSADSLTDEHIKNHNLILWGDPESNPILGKVAKDLPIQWDAKGIHAGDKIYSRDNHALIMICPNPLNPDRYVVLNSSFTFREYAYLNNARQAPMLPDWAVVDLRHPPTTQWPGKVVDAGFFDEQWKWKSKPSN